ncbi:NUDIX hydrolase [Sphingobacterium sp. Mn56C]|uniref:NUDIX hydrolase n=1 Tax=Sphingobacterium sp. Mn56C TaxID=3395261 RepID=UPI003BF61D2E
MPILKTAGLVVVAANKLLLAFSKNKQAWYLPGGKIDAGEDALQALQREVLEELNLVLDPGKINYYCHITAPAFGEAPDLIMEQDCFRYDLREDITPGNEIDEVKYFTYQEYLLEEYQVVGVLQVFDILVKDGSLRSV